MKLIHKLTLGVCLLATVTVQAQKKHVTHKPNVTKVPVVKLADPDAEFKKLHPEVKSVTWERGMIVTLEKFDGSKERFSLDRFDDEQRAKKLYGKMPAPPPPPPGTAPLPTPAAPPRSL